MGVVIVSVWHFFAPFISIPIWPAYESLIPAETVFVGQQPEVVINISHLLLMVIGGAVVWKL